MRKKLYFPSLLGQKAQYVNLYHMYTVLKAHLYSCQKTLDFGNWLTNIWVINNFAWKDKEKQFLSNKTISEGS